MNSPDLETFWTLVAESRLVEPDHLHPLRGECPARDAVEAAKWLCGRGGLTLWQARRLARGDRGPFFIAGHRLMDRLDAAGPGLLFRARHEATGRRVQLVLLDRSLCKQQDVWTGIVRRTTIAHAARDPLLSRTIALEQADGHRFILCEDIPSATLAAELDERPVTSASCRKPESRLPSSGKPESRSRSSGKPEAHNAMFPFSGKPEAHNTMFPFSGKPEAQAEWNAGRPGTPVETACRIALEVARAVAELHRLGDVHAAISLDAVRREPVAAGGDPRTGRVRLAQFPLAGDPHLQPPRMPLESADRLEKLGRQVCFVAPELMRAGSHCDPRSDVYAIGCLVHALVTGTFPNWEGDAHRTLARAVADGVPPLVTPAVPAALAAVVATMTARDPGARYPTAVEAADALATCLGMPPTSASPPPLAVAMRPDGGGSAVRASSPHSGSVPGAPLPFADPSAAFPVIESGRHSAVSSSGGRLQRPQRRRRGVSPSTWLVGGLLAMLAVSGVGIAVVGSRGSSRSVAKPAAAVPTMAEADAPTEPTHDDRGLRSSDAEAAAESPQSAGGRAGVILVDDPLAPWQSPTAGPPPSLAYLPPGSQLVLLVRPAEMAADEEATLFLRGLGPSVARAAAAVQDLCGCGLDGIEQIQAGWQAGGPGEVIGGYAIRLRDPADEAAITARIADAKASEAGDETIHVGKNTSLWMPRAEKGRVLVCGDEKLVRDVIAAEADAGPVGDGATLRAQLPRDMEELVGMLDRSRHVTLLGSPHYLRSDGHELLAGPAERLVEPLRNFFGDAVRAAAVSLHFGESFYVELDAVETVKEPARLMAKNFLKKIESASGSVEDWNAGLVDVQFGRKLINRLPVMVSFLARHVRAGAEGKGVVVNAYLPRHAGHNLALATELALAQAGGGGGAVGTKQGTAKQGAAQPAGARQKLATKISLAFARDTLDRSVQLLSEEIDLPIKILGDDLKVEGITKNQSFGLDERDKPAAEILRIILRKANNDGKLVYVIRGQGDGDSLVVTTRAAAVERGDKLPPEFDAPAAVQQTP